MKVRVGLGSCGIAAGALKVWQALDALAQQAGIRLEKERTGCNGMCYLEPLVDVIDGAGTVYSYGHVDPRRMAGIIDSHASGGPLQEYLINPEEHTNEFLHYQVRVALRNCGLIDPESLSDYLASGGYGALRKAIEEMGPKGVIEAVQGSGLRGRGGAGFPTWLKWLDTRSQPADTKYVICNADEGDPGAFMDRSLLEGDPHSVLEGMAIAAYAVGAKEGIIYCRAEYPLAIERLSKAIAQAGQAGFLGRDIFGSGFDLNIHVKQGAGAFVCGEETALTASLEGERGMPRLKPPYPSVKGYWDLPTNINNVETFANVPWIIAQGAPAFAALGTENSKGTKVFALAGRVKRGGLVEVPMGITLREVIYGIGGGIKDDKDFKAVQMGGPAGGCIPENYLDTPLDYEAITQLGAIMGSGGMIVVDEGACMVEMARYFLEFTQKESCGKCVQCRIGTRRMLDIMTRICSGEGKPEDIDLLQELGEQVSQASLCGLGQGAPNPVLTTLKYFRAEYEAHIIDKKCPAKQCKALIQYVIDESKCSGCTICAKKCPADCISGKPREVHVIDQDRCTKCGTCLEVCPDRFAAIRVE